MRTDLAEFGSQLYYQTSLLSSAHVEDKNDRTISPLHSTSSLLRYRFIDRLTHGSCRLHDAYLGRMVCVSALLSSRGLSARITGACRYRAGMRLHRRQP